MEGIERWITFLQTSFWVAELMIGFKKEIEEIKGRDRFNKETDWG